MKYRGVITDARINFFKIKIRIQVARGKSCENALKKDELQEILRAGSQFEVTSLDKGKNRLKVGVKEQLLGCVVKTL